MRTLLIANRGEIAVRIVRTARRMGLRTIAVFSDADAGALHVRVADEAHRIGPAPARESYLNAEAILAAARDSGADAVHPGYGFLSENADFAEACLAADIAWIGPPPAAIRAMGSKSEAKALMQAAGVPVVPGYHGADQSPARLAREAEAIGYPVLIKASAGGGGRGMRIVERPDALAEALASAQREAKASFGDDRLLIERYLARPRHIEMQVFADAYGNTIHLLERDCSIQRRHQKVIEEAPAPGLDPAQRAAMGRAAVEAARAVGYVGAGTVEFIAEDDHFFFMEMNTRLQVEHPVTEAVTGLDLVEWQIRVARGEPLPLGQDDVRARGHAIEARLYAEDPARGFLPQAGRIEHLVLPDDVRVDAGVESGDRIPLEYDPMIAKIVAHGADRTEAILRLSRALAATELVGPVTNRAFLAAIVGHPAFAAADLDTGFVARHEAELLPPAAPADETMLALAALALLRQAERDARASADPTDPFSPWTALSGWRLGGRATTTLLMLDGDAPIAIRATWHGTGYRLELPSGTLDVDGAVDAARIGARQVKARAVRHGDRLTIFGQGRARSFTIVDPARPASAAGTAGGHLKAPMPGTVVAVAVAPGDAVAKGAPLVTVEAMKMEHAVTAPRDGVVQAVNVAVGDKVDEGVELVVLEDAA
jgi:3-methylcrotonyl-CoA carboxylase alpha subunit